MKEGLISLFLLAPVLAIASCGSDDGEGQLAGESCRQNADCTQGAYCQYPDRDCGSASIGTCETRPDACVEVFEPACGCDGQTYTNSCFAAQVGVSIAALRDCAAEE